MPLRRWRRSSLFGDACDHVSRLQSIDLVLDTRVADPIQVGEEPFHARTAVQLVAGTTVVNGRGIEQIRSIKAHAVRDYTVNGGVLKVGYSLQIRLVRTAPLIEDSHKGRQIGVKVRGSG